MIYEVRTYTLKPGSVAKFEENFGKALPARQKYSKLGAFWHTANSCIAPMTLRSFIVARPPDLGGLVMVAACTTVSTPAFLMTLPIRGLRMSARTNSARPMRRRRSLLGETESTAMTRSMAGF